ncbi:MAG: hypothetical protein PHI23_02060 [Candidatus Peribacteraceae bacterium]|nr:hypothetical protein [Candidatus Peribacteraceae bacterium]
MKRPLASLLLGLSLLQPLGALAAPSENAISDQYVKHVIERVKKGIDHAKEGSGEAPVSMRIPWLISLASTFFALIDTDLRLSDQERDLLANSPCLHWDLSLLEQWIEEVRQEQRAAFEQSSLIGIMRFASLSRYLNARFKAILLGGRDPTYVDKGEGMRYYFDPPPYWCCTAEAVDEEEGTGEAGTCQKKGDDDQATKCLQERGTIYKRLAACKDAGCTGPGSSESEPENFCPFDSDYLPATSVGYGCDLSVLGKIQGEDSKSIKAEYKALQKLVEKRDEFINGMRPLKESIETIERTLNIPPSDLTDFQAGLESRRAHKRLTGCLPAGKELPEGLAAVEKRGPFSFTRDERKLLGRLYVLWRGWGSSRKFPDYLKTSKEFPEGSTEQEQAKSREQSPFAFLYMTAQYAMRTYFLRWTTEQSGDESLSIAKTSDAPMEILEVLKPLRKEMSAMAQTTKSPRFGFRGFVRNFAYFLRRSCLFRPCNEQLETILKIVFENACFPYADADSIFEDSFYGKCADAAGVSGP